MTAENLPAVRPVEMVADFTPRDLDVFLAHLRRVWDGDPESAHSIEDDLKSRVLRLVVEEHPHAAAFAAKVLEIDGWDVTRWFA